MTDSIQKNIRLNKKINKKRIEFTIEPMFIIANLNKWVSRCFRKEYSLSLKRIDKLLDFHMNRQMKNTMYSF